MNLVYTGTTSIATIGSEGVFQSGKITVSDSNPPNPLNPGFAGLVQFYTPDSELINWDTPAMGILPPILNGQTVQSISQSSQFSSAVINRRIVLQVKSGFACDYIGQAPTLTITLQLRDPEPPPLQINLTSETQVLFSKTIGTANGTNYYCGSTCPSFVYDVPTNLNVKVSRASVIPYKSNRFVTAQSVCNFSMTAQMSVTLTISCGSDNLLNEMHFCSTYCLANRDNIRLCRDNYTTVCFAPSSTSRDIILTNNDACQNFFERYYTEFGPDNTGLDNKLTGYCLGKYGTVGFKGLFADLGNLFDQRICACRMPDVWYDQFAESLRGFNPNFLSYIDVTGVNKRCLVSQCAASVFTTAQITDETSFVCKIPPCVNVTNFTNNGGTFDSVSIVQEQTCQTINNQGSSAPPPTPPTPPTPTEQTSWLSKYWWVLLIITLALLLFIIIIIVIVKRRK